ncbi:hypothetical protein ACROYT_G032629 [Oculina patagonica]
MLYNTLRVSKKADHLLLYYRLTKGVPADITSFTVGFLAEEARFQTIHDIEWSSQYKPSSQAGDLIEFSQVFVEHLNQIHRLL